MFGYVRPSMDRLTEADKQRFQAVYCGLCRTLGERYGTAARFILNYDFTFLAVLLSDGEAEESAHRRCMAHPFEGRDYFPENDALALAADCSVILAWWQLRDAVADHSGAKRAAYRAAAGPLRSAYRRARELRPAFDTFAQLLQGIAREVPDPRKARVLDQFFYHLGRWIYLIDAADDLAEDFSDQNYNPLIHRFSLTEGKLSEEARESLVISLDHSIRLMAAAFELWDFGVWNPIIRSTVYEGLFSVGRAVLEGTFHAGGQRARASGRDEEQL